MVGNKYSSWYRRENREKYVVKNATFNNLKELGQFVKKDDTILTIKTDQGSAVQIKAPQNGVIVKLNKNINDVVLVGNDLFELDESKTRDIKPERIRETAPSNTGPQS